MAPPAFPHRILVAGGGPVGLTTALALARAGISTTLVTPRANSAQPGRTVALLGPSMTLLRRLGVAARLTPSPILGIRLIDDTGGLLRAPEVTFRPSDIGQTCFGHNVANTELEAALRSSLAGHRDNLDWIDGASVTCLDITPTHVAATLSGTRTVQASAVIACDGRASLCRQAADIGVETHAYAQAAVTATFAHIRPHDGISTEFHRAAGPCTTVPLPGHTSSLVWVEHPARAQELAAMNDTDFAATLEQSLQGLLGTISAVSPRGHFPLTWLKALTPACRRVFLAGESAHVIPPIGAQGLNLGLRDAATLVDVLAEAIATGADPGSEPVLDAYRRARSFDIATRMTAVDALNRSLLSNTLPVHLARGLGLHAVRALAPLRRRIIQAGMVPPGTLPRLMQPDAA